MGASGLLFRVRSPTRDLRASGPRSEVKSVLARCFVCLVCKPEHLAGTDFMRLLLRPAALLRRRSFFVVRIASAQTAARAAVESVGAAGLKGAGRSLRDPQASPVG